MHCDQIQTNRQKAPDNKLLVMGKLKKSESSWGFWSVE